MVECVAGLLGKPVKGSEKQAPVGRSPSCRYVQKPKGDSHKIRGTLLGVHKIRIILFRLLF